MSRRQLLCITVLCFTATLSVGAEYQNERKMRSGLKWVSKEEAKDLPFGFGNPNLVRPTLKISNVLGPLWPFLCMGHMQRPVFVGHVDTLGLINQGRALTNCTAKLPHLSYCALLCSGLSCCDLLGTRIRYSSNLSTAKYDGDVGECICLQSPSVRPYRDFPFRLICRAEVGGCQYPGEAFFDPNDNDGYPVCRPITKTEVRGPRQNFQLLYNPQRGSKVTWRNWPDGTGDLNFPSGVVKSDDVCNLMVGRYNDRSISSECCAKLEINMPNL